MITGLFVFLVVGAMGLHYFFVDRPRLKAAGHRPSKPEPISLTEAMKEPPGGFFLQPTFTWARLRDNGEFFLGVHPLLLSLVGPETSMDMVPDNFDVEKGDPLLHLRLGDRELQVFSPIAGHIVEVNDEFLPQAGWAGATSRGGSWLFRIRPRAAKAEIPFWLLGPDASRWAHQEYREVRDFLFETETHDEVGLMAADGGELPTGVMTQLDAEAWASFQDRFLPNPEEDGTEE